MQNKRNSIMRAFSFSSSGSSKDSMHSMNRTKSLGDRSSMAVYIDNVLLPKHVTDSFYATWLHCYEELFEASLSLKSSHFKFDWTARKDPEKLGLEKAKLCGISLDSDLKGKYTQQRELIHHEEEGEDSLNEKSTEETSYKNNNLRPAFPTTKLFSGRKKAYRLSYNDGI